MTTASVQYELKGACSSDSDVGELLDDAGKVYGTHPSPGLRPWLRRAGLAVAALMVCCLVAVVTLRRDGQTGRARASMGKTVGLVSIETDLAAVKAANPDWDPEYWDELESGKKAENREEVNKQKTCHADEEIFGGLCYKKCDLLTGNEYPIRTTAFTCCKETPCHPFNSKKDMGFCSGYSVGGGETETCPHPPTGCLADEEVTAGLCYKKCSLLTNNEYPHRLTNMACCKIEMSYKCMFRGNLRVSSSFNVGSGVDEMERQVGITAAPSAMPQEVS